MAVEVAGVATGSSALPGWASVLAVVAHPDDESFGLGAVLDGFAHGGASVAVLCLTKGEASTVHGISGDLRTLRAMELKDAAGVLGVKAAVLSDFPDSGLARVSRRALVREILETARRVGAEGLVVFDPSGVTGHPDHAAASAAAVEAAAAVDLPVLGWTLPRAVAEQLNEELDTRFVGHAPSDIDLTVAVDRGRQRAASLAHASQAVPTSVLWRRLELLGDLEHLRWLRVAGDTGPGVVIESQAAPATSDPLREPDPDPDHAPQDGLAVGQMRVDYVSGDRFDISIRDHTVTVDQPAEMPGDEAGPTPTELFVAALASCVAFYARRYLRRHGLDAAGLTVETAYRLDPKAARVPNIDVRIRLPHELPTSRANALLAVAGHCTVHRSIITSPEITIGF